MSVIARLDDLGVRQTSGGGELRVFSESATSMELCIFDDADPNWIVKTVPMARDAHGVWSARSRSLSPGTQYSLRVDGPRGPTAAFNPALHLLDPYARALRRVTAHSWRSVVPETRPFDWGTVTKPNTPLDRTVVYEAHVKGLTQTFPGVPAHLRGTYAGLAHESTIEYLTGLGVTAVELLPVHQHVSERRLVRQGLVNYWGYNTLSYFAPHASYASPEARAGGPDAILREFKGMVKHLHAAGLEVILDVVYNHTAEEGLDGPKRSFRGIDNATYYRHRHEDGAYIDVTGCGNTVDFSRAAPVQMVLDSLKYWANDVQVDGFRFDLAPVLGRNAQVSYDREHPLLAAIVGDPDLADVKMIAEPWDVGIDGWQTGNFPHGFSEWNDRYRDDVRSFWLSDLQRARHTGSPETGAGALATRLAGSSNLFEAERGPLASINFVTAHDGFTMADLATYNTKHNVMNGESNRDGTDGNRSFNHGVEGPTSNPRIMRDRLRSIRNLMGTLLLSAGVPMITAGDEIGRTQRGNNNAYCHDSELTWISWELRDWQRDLQQTARHLLRLRRENPALRPARFARSQASTPSASEMHWYTARGESMRDEYWAAPQHRTLQFLAASTPEFEDFNRVLLVVNGLEWPVSVSLPQHEGVEQYTLLWDSAITMADQVESSHAPGAAIAVAGPSLRLYRAEGEAPTVAGSATA
ncbi:glycogen debranching protein GlgX [Planctomonas deserti]|uniref:glycogen debranching protein GlgX n=1 Tax=Planctomonas deserti TaxID=2144185 RepID=UPI001F0C2C21|nr:glycogen debranching protein GlgX [Planctomonas deserti]